MKKVKNFTDPTDKTSAARCTQQISEFEDNTDAETASIRATFLPALPARLSEVAASGQVLQSGEALGFDTTSGDVDVLLPRPSAKDGGKFRGVFKRVAANNVNLVAALGTTVNAAASVSRASVGFTLIYCDGTEYWV